MNDFPRRIICLGVTGSGKSTLARGIGSALGLPIHLVDEEFGWLPGWVSRDPDEQKRLASEAASGDSWVFDSAYSFYRQEIIERAELVVCLDYPRLFSLARLLRRCIRRAVFHEPMCNGNYESWGRMLGHESILRWHFKTFSMKRRQMRALEKELGSARVLRFSSARETQGWLASLEASHPWES
ncbi:adenylate kinase [Arthrobacter sp. MYb227]|uniref:adenylate kinase n=1 Tax=Arthrobacter sp. MYb227 TaxID=1848601 RepID=UPI000CFE1FD9|nr:adenylate kinase [Arthrobacter sp. MYb227]PQZ95747.1 adenylate kinase [Arthrobacter sp. MYb227]